MRGRFDYRNEREGALNAEEEERRGLEGARRIAEGNVEVAKRKWADTRAEFEAVISPRPGE